MNRQWAAFGTTLSIAVVTAAVAGPVTDDETPLHKVLEKVNINNTAILKGTRSAANYAKGQKDVAKAADELSKLSKEAKGLGDEAVKAQKKTMDEWNKLAEALIVETDK